MLVEFLWQKLLPYQSVQLSFIAFSITIGGNGAAPSPHNWRRRAITQTFHCPILNSRELFNRHFLLSLSLSLTFDPNFPFFCVRCYFIPPAPSSSPPSAFMRFSYANCPRMDGGRTALPAEWREHGWRRGRSVTFRFALLPSLLLPSSRTRSPSCHRHRAALS